MSARNRGAVTVQFGDGSKLTAFTSVSLRDSFIDPLGAYSFETRPLRGQIAEYRAKLQRGELITVKVNATTIGTYLITTRRARYGREGAVFSVEAKSVLATAYEGMVDPRLDFTSQTDTPVDVVVLKALSPYGFDTLIGDDGANRSAMAGKSIIGKGPKIQKSSLKDRKLAAQDAEPAYAFCSRVFNRLGVALRVDFEGKLILEAPDYDQDPIATLVSDFDGSTPGDRLLDGWEFVESNDGQYSECVITGVAPDDPGTNEAGTPVARVRAADILPLGASAKEVQDLEDFLTNETPHGKLVADRYAPDRATYVSSAAPYKPLIVKDKNARDRKRCASVAKLALGIRARNAVYVEGEVDGWVALTGALWTPNTTVRLVLAQEDIDETWWILERVFTEDRENGQKTRLKLLPKGALVLGDVPTD